MKKKYVKDYVSTEKGELTYRGKYYHSEMPDEERKKISIMQLIYGISSFILVILALCIPCSGNRTIYVVIPVEITLVCLVYYIVGSWALYKTEGRMELKDYEKAYQGPIQMLTISIILYIFSLGGQIIGILMEVSQRSIGDIYFAMILGFVFVLSAVVWNRQRKMMHYITEEKTAVDFGKNKQR